MQITPLGDSALMVHVADRFEADPAGSLEHVLAALRRLELAALPGVVEAAPAYSTVTLFYDPARVDYATLEGAVRDVLATGRKQRLEREAPRLVEIPVCYAGDCGPDLEAAARHARLSPEDFISRHTAVEYRVHCLGFSPGFPYLGGLPTDLHVPRRTIPRVRVPAGSVGIGGGQ